MMYVSILFYIFTGILLSYFINLRQLSRIYVGILSALCVYSVLCTYLMRILPDQGLLSVPVFRNSNGVEFYDFLFSGVSLDYVAKRNFGIFREPGVYQFFILLALILNNEQADFEKPWITWTCNGILCFTMLTTFATGGVAEMGLLAIFLFFDKKWYESTWGKITAAAAVLLVGGLAAWILITKNALYTELYGMVEKLWTTPPSESRFLPIVKDFELFLKHPILGEKLGKVMHLVENNTTTTMVLLAGMGIFGGILHFSGLTALLFHKKRNLFGNLILLVIFLMAINTQNFNGNMIFWIFPTMAVCERYLPLSWPRRSAAD